MHTKDYVIGLFPLHIHTSKLFCMDIDEATKS